MPEIHHLLFAPFIIHFLQSLGDVHGQDWSCQEQDRIPARFITSYCKLWASIYFVWLAATLKVITSGITQPHELWKPLPIAHLWLFNFSVHVPMKSSGWDAGLLIKSTQETMLLGKYIEPWPLRDMMKYESRREKAKRGDMQARFAARFGWLMVLLVSVSFWKRAEGSSCLETWVQHSGKSFT